MPSDETASATATFDPAALGVEVVTRETESVIVAGRYRLVRLLGRGGHGDVWEAIDAVTGDTVALKRLGAGAPAAAARVRREVAALRLLRLPGVVRLLDEGVENGRTFLVMDRVEGEPFPGKDARPLGWGDVEGPTIALLETLARIHAAGVVHRDLKPANVLVSADGRPTVLDFGIAVDQGAADALTQDGVILGTPAFLAPEQVTSEPITPRTDLYAVGVMLHEALTGEVPHATDSVPRLLLARASQRPRPLRERTTRVPAAIASVVDALLSPSPDDRPRSAVEALRRLRGDRVALPEGPELPLVGRDEALGALLEALRAGRSVELVGPAGSGRTRLLREVTRALEAEGREVAWAAPGGRPFTGVDAIVGPLAGFEGARLADVQARVEAALRGRLRGRLVVVADDAERLDRWSAAALDACAGEGAVVRARLDATPPGRASTTVRVGPLDEAALGALFLGAERLVHVRSDAARALHDRTEGLPARVAEELDAWVRGGLARLAGPRVAIDRAALDRLETGIPVVAPRRLRTSIAPRAALAGLAPSLEDLAAWTALAWPHTEPELLAQALDVPLWQVEAELDELGARGLVRRLADGRAEPLGPATQGALLESWSWERRLAAHKALARVLPRGAEGRLHHLLVAADPGDPLGSPTELAAEARARADALTAVGRLGHATAALHETLLALRARAAGSGEAAPDAEASLLEAWVLIAISEGTPHALDRVLYEICRAEPRSWRLGPLEELVRAALTLPTDAARARALAERIAPFDAIELERRRQGLRALGAARGPLDEEDALLEELEWWAIEADHPLARASWEAWSAAARYRRGAYAEAAAKHLAAAGAEPWPTEQLAARIAAASSLLEAFELDDAARIAAEATALARACRHPVFEGRAEWIARSAAYRSGRAHEVDEELVEAVADLGVAKLEALVLLNEAAVAWRAGRRERAAELATRAERVWERYGNPWAARFARSLALASGATAGEGEVERLVRDLIGCPLAGVGLQAIALLHDAGAKGLPTRDEALALTHPVARERWSVRMDVMTVEEVLGRMGVSA